ncbi:NAD(P)H-hydrate dehydratase, partial [Jannaschia sp. LMIT008]|uniref:NAD(P)H-hydrate dehydratase n=1 Tax=Jannaschia maritima TaxID=3032585 RepID=UPI0028121744
MTSDARPDPAAGAVCNGPALWRAAFPWPDAEGHKYDRGHAAMLSGPAGRGGAIRLAARAALRVGAGLVTVLAPADAVAEHAARLDAVMVREAADDGALARMAARDGRFDAVCLGPAFGRDRAASVLPALLTSDRALVLDADALHALPPPATLRGAAGPVVLTPHAGEFAAAFPDIDPADRVDAAMRAAERTGCILILKGSRTVVAAPDGRRAVNDPATPFLATAGSGDVLAGIATGLLAQGMPAFEAAAAAIWLHAECAAAVGPGLIA